MILCKGGLGADNIDGGFGIDTADYSDSQSGVTVNLRDNTENAGDVAVGDDITSIENLNGSDYNDRLIGDSDDNVFIGGNGHDVLEGWIGGRQFVRRLW